MKNASIFALALAVPAAAFSSSFSGSQMRSVSNSATMTVSERFIDFILYSNNNFLSLSIANEFLYRWSISPAV